MSIELDKVLLESVTCKVEEAKEGTDGCRNIKVIFNTENELLREIINFEPMNTTHGWMIGAEKAGRAFVHNNWISYLGMTTMVISPPSTVCESDDAFGGAFIGATYMLGIKAIDTICKVCIKSSSPRTELHDLCLSINNLSFQKFNEVTDKDELRKNIEEMMNTYTLPRYLGRPLVNTIEKLSLGQAKRLTVLVRSTFPLGLVREPNNILDAIPKPTSPANGPQVKLLVSNGHLKSEAEKFLGVLLDQLSQEETVDFLKSTCGNEKVDDSITREDAIKLLCQYEGES